MKDRQPAPGYRKTNGNATDLRLKAQDFGVNEMVLHLTKEKNNKQTLFRPTTTNATIDWCRFIAYKRIWYFPVAIHKCYPYRSI